MVVVVLKNIKVIEVDYGGFLYQFCPGGDCVVSWVDSVVEFFFVLFLLLSYFSTYIEIFQDGF